MNTILYQKLKRIKMFPFQKFFLFKNCIACRKKKSEG
jgi:hypothetical protein